MAYLSGASGNSSGGGFTNPMPNGTFLETIDKDDNQISLIGYAFESVVVGDYVFGNQLLLVSTDDFTTFSTFATLGDEGFSANTEAGGAEMTVGYNITSKETEARYETPLADTTGMTHRSIMLSELAANDNLLHTFTSEGSNDTQNNVVYAGEKVKAKNVATGSEEGEVTRNVIIGGVETEYQTADQNGITNKLMTRFDAQAVTGGVAYAAFETGFNSNTYGWQFGAGTTVPGAVAGWNGAAFFTDADATGVNRTWINIGTSSTASFRRIAYWGNSAGYTVSNDTPTRSLNVSTATLTDVANVLATLLRDLNIT